MNVNRKLIQKAEELKPALLKRRVKLAGTEQCLQEGDSEVYDFGEHLTGRLAIAFSYEGHHPDAPALLRIHFAENVRELEEDAAAYRGWISPSWIQTETVHVDRIPGTFRLGRRYAFRYVRIEVLSLSTRFTLKIRGLTAVSETSADEAKLPSLSAELLPRGEEELLSGIDSVACRTLRECMQEVFEDGPKRDRRLWLGDLRLQALTNYVTYRNNDLVKRCLYLFAGTAFPDGRLASNVFVEPRVEADDSYMFDYAMLFVKALQDYVNETEDSDCLRELWPATRKQILGAEQYFGEDGLIHAPEEPVWCFLDWNLELDKETGALGVWLYCAEAAVDLARRLKDHSFTEEICEKIRIRREAARTLLRTPDGLFTSGPMKQISMASQVWAILGGISSDPGILTRAEQCGALKMVSPYLCHYYIEALIKTGKKQEALDMILRYWGGMIREGADTFWELYDPEDPDASPYGGTVVNSYCHAWSCTPAYFIREGLLV